MNKSQMYDKLKLLPITRIIFQDTVNDGVVLQLFPCLLCRLAKLCIMDIFSPAYDMADKRIVEHKRKKTNLLTNVFLAIRTLYRMLDDRIFGQIAIKVRQKVQR